MYKALNLNFSRKSLSAVRCMAKSEPIQPYLLLRFAETIEASIGVDIGANVGAYALAMANQADIGRVYAFEPDDAARAELEANIDLNGLGRRITVDERAVSDIEGVAEFGQVGPASGINAMMSTTFHDQRQYSQRRHIDCTTLDAVLPDAPKGAMGLKIDVEGHEINVIRGAMTQLRHRDSVLQVECYRGIERLGSELATLGYREIMRVGPDYYFSNARALLDPQVATGAVKLAIDQFLFDRRHEVPHIPRTPRNFFRYLTGRPLS
jgi:FkbM family methyltransferase